MTQQRLYSTLSSSRTCCLSTISISTWSTINSRCICIIINVVVWQLLSLNYAYIQQGNTLFQKALKDAFNDLVNREVGKFKTGKIMLMMIMMINIFRLLIMMMILMSAMMMITMIAMMMMKMMMLIMIKVLMMMMMMITIIFVASHHLTLDMHVSSCQLTY